MIPNKHVSFFITLSIGLCFPMLAWGATTPSLGGASTYGVLSSTYTNTTITTVNGDVGFTTPPAVAPLGTRVHYGSSTPYSIAGTDQGVALGVLNAQGCDFIFGVATDLSLLAQPLVPGVYCITAAASVGTAGITLDGGGTYIFRIDGTLNTDANAEVTLTNGASACDVFWTPTGATTLGANTVFKGTVISDAGITVGANSSWDGRALSFGETVTTDTTVINNICGATPATLQVIKLVDNTDGGSAISSDFMIHVLLSGNDVVGSPASGNAIAGTTYALYADTYLVTENTSGTYSAIYGGDCSLTGSVVLLPGDAKTCTITNTYIPVPAGGSQTSIVVDTCPDGDDSGDAYDGICVRPTSAPPPEPEQEQLPNSGDDLSLMPITTIPPNKTIEPFVFGAVPTNTDTVMLPITLPAQLPNSGAAGPESNNLLKIIALGSLLLAIFSGIDLKKRVR